MQALLSKQQVKRRKNSSYTGNIIPFDRYLKAQKPVSTRGKLPVKVERAKKTKDVGDRAGKWKLLKPNINLLLIYILLAIIVLTVAYVWYSRAIITRRKNDITLSFPQDNTFDTVLFRTLIPESEQRYTSSGKLSPKLIKTLRVTNYRVKNGDSLSRIAARFGLSLGTIISFNGIKDARLLRVGTVLHIPNRNGLKYEVRRGDSLSGIAKRFGVPLNELVDWNNLKSSVIHPGQELFIVGAKMRTNELNRVLGKLFIYPTHGIITSPFGMRHDPFTGIMRFHNGVDIANRVGTKIVASMAGVVARTGINPTYGRYIIIRHEDGFQTLYAHLSRILVRRGEHVRQDELIGRMGNTGYSTGPHLHFSIFKNGKPVDPLRYLH